MGKWWIGCSGFYYKGWKEKFYPKGLPQRKWFEYYCDFFNTVELNVTFYRLPKPEVLKGWNARSPDDFRFTVKAPRLITHFKRFNNARQETQGFYDLITGGLGEKLGTVLFQLHPQFPYTEENLEKVLETLDPAYTNVLEFRHPSWWCDAVVSVLNRHKVSFCGISYPGLPDAVMKTSSTLYYRFHGVPQLYLSSYSDESLKLVADEIRSQKDVKDVYAYFNNDIEVAAIFNAQKLQALISN